MATLSTLGSMMMNLQPQLKDYNQALLEGQRLQAGRTGNQTALLELAELQRQVQTAEMARQYQREHPEVLLGQPAPGGTPTSGLGSLPTTAGPLTQTTQVPGQAPQTQTIPAYPDASRYAQAPGGGPWPTDQPSLGRLPTRPDPLRALAQQNPDAARLVMQQQQAQQDRAIQVEEGRLKRQLTVAGAVAQILQGATDQPSYAIALERLQELAPQIAQRLPPTYSKEAVQPYLDMALSRKETVQAQIDTMTQQVEGYKANVLAQQKAAEVEYLDTPQGRVAVPKYPGAGGTSVAGTPVTVGGQPVGSLQGQQQTQTQQEQTRSAESGMRKEYEARVETFREVTDTVNAAAAAGQKQTVAGDQALISAFAKLNDPRTGVRDAERRELASGQTLPGQLAYWQQWTKGGALLPADIHADIRERIGMLYDAYKQEYSSVAQEYRDLAARSRLNPENVVVKGAESTGKQPDFISLEDFARARKATGMTEAQLRHTLAEKNIEVRPRRAYEAAPPRAR